MTQHIHEGAARYQPGHHGNNLPVPSATQALANPQQLLTEHIDLWTSAVRHKSTAGRGSNRKLELAGINKLRELILELAVRGKLVPQNPDDEPASELLKRIEAEKAQLIKDGKLKKQKPLPPVSEDEKPFELPQGWVWVRLGDVLEVINGRAYKKHEMLGSGTPLLRVGNLFTSNEWYYSNLELEPNKYIDNGDLIYAWSASFGPFIWEGGKVIYHYHIWKLEIFDENSLFKPFIYNYLKAITEQIKASGNGIAMLHMTKDRMEKLVIPLPPLAEQQRIVAKVDELMALCDQLEQQSEHQLDAHQQLTETLLSALLNPAAGALTNATSAQELNDNWQRLAQHFDLLFSGPMGAWAIDRLKDTILQLAVMGKLVPQNPDDEPAAKLLKRIDAEKARLVKEGKIKKQKPLPPVSDDEKPFELPQGWEWSRLPEIGELARGKSKHRPRNDPRLYKEGKYPLIQTGDVARSNGSISTYGATYNDFGLEQSRLWPAKTLCITIAANIADTGLLEFDACFPDSIVGFNGFLSVNNRFYEFFVRTYKEKLAEFAPSTAQKNINLEILSSMLVPVSPLAEQHRIVAKVDELFALCDQLKERLQHASDTQLNLTDAIVEQALN